MAYRMWEVLLGAVVVAVAVVFVVFALRSTGTTLSQASSYDLRATFRSAEGVRTGTEVRLAGVKIGSVTNITLNPQTFRAEVTIGVDQAVQLPLDSSI